MNILSLTSTRARLFLLQHCWASLARQTPAPDRILLQLARNEFPEGEDYVLQALSSFGSLSHLEVSLVEDLRSYKKLLPVVDSFGREDFLITVDDDVIYHPSFTQRMSEAALAYPQHIICGSARRIRKNLLGGFYNYYRWPITTQPSQGADLLPIGATGVGYRRELVDLDFLRDVNCMIHAPTADDLWFKIAAHRKGTRVFCDPKIFSGSMPLEHGYGLSAINTTDRRRPDSFTSRVFSLVRREFMDSLGINRTRNDVQWDAALRYSEMLDGDAVVL